MTVVFDPNANSLSATVFLYTVDSNGSMIGLAGKTIDFYLFKYGDLGSIKIGDAVTAEDGTAEFQIALNTMKGVYSEIARFEGNQEFASSSCSRDFFIPGRVTHLVISSISRENDTVSVCLQLLDKQNSFLFQAGKPIYFDKLIGGYQYGYLLTNFTAHIVASVVIEAGLNFTYLRVIVPGDDYIDRFTVLGCLNLSNPQPMLKFKCGDAYQISGYFMRRYPDPKYDVFYDVNDDGRIDMRDIAMIIWYAYAHLESPLKTA